MQNHKTLQTYNNIVYLPPTPWEVCPYDPNMEQRTHGYRIYHNGLWEHNAGRIERRIRHNADSTADRVEPEDIR
jgi:hypothetical protein